jgi:hypothetical protein
MPWHYIRSGRDAPTSHSVPFLSAYVTCIEASSRAPRSQTAARTSQRRYPRSSLPRRQQIRQCRHRLHRRPPAEHPARLPADHRRLRPPYAPQEQIPHPAQMPRRVMAGLAPPQKPVQHNAVQQRLQGVIGVRHRRSRLRRPVIRRRQRPRRGSPSRSNALQAGWKYLWYRLSTTTGLGQFNAPGCSGVAGKRDCLVSVRIRSADGGLANVARASRDQYRHICSLSSEQSLPPMRRGVQDLSCRVRYRVGIGFGRRPRGS